MDASELGRWTRFAAKGGIGKCTALQDCIAEQPEDLMFLKDDEIVVLMQIPGHVDLYLGYCEGVVGNFRGDAVRFHARLKKPVLTKRQSTASPVSRPSSSQSAFTVSARDAPSPAVFSSRDVSSPVMLSPAVVRDVPPPRITPPQIEPSLSSSSSITISAAPLSPVSPHPERSMSHESQATSLSSIPITPADDGVDNVSIASDTASLVPPIRLDEIAKQLSDDSPVEHVHSSELTASRFPPVDRDSSVYSDDELPNPRISVASSDNGGVNIGLSLLQDFAGGGDVDDSDSDEEQFSAIRRVQSPESTLELSVPVPMSAGSESQYSETPNDTTHFARVASPDSTVEGHPAPPSIRSESQYSASPRSTTQPLDPPLATQSERSESNYSGSPMSTRAPLPAAARPESEYDFSEDWEGADDIYDQYRYSRYSMASRMSRMSKGSMHTIGSVGSDAPPVPTPAERPSLESNRERKGSKGKIPSRLAESTTQADMEADADEEEESTSPMSKMQKNRPAPLTFRKEPEPSPLLHATFGSPQASPTAPSATSGSFASPTLVDPIYPMNAGAATNNRKRHEDGSDSEDSGEDEQDRRSGQELAAPGRDDRMPASAMSQAAEIVNEHLPRQSPPPTPAVPPLSPRSTESSAALEKRRLAVANADPTDEPPPPPYSSSAAPGPSGSTSQAPTPATSPPPGNPVVIPPPTHPTARPIDPNRQQVHPMMRQSLFMPHPGAPKPAAASLGPMYGRPNQQAPPNQPFPPHVGPPPGSVHQVLGMAFQARREGRPAPPTIYGRLEFDLSMSLGPVPITFSTEPQNNIPANRPMRPPVAWVPPPGTLSAGPSRVGSPASLLGTRTIDPTGRMSATSPPLRGPSPLQGPSAGPPMQIDQVLADVNAGRGVSPAPSLGAGAPRRASPAPVGANGPIQRANFTPQVGAARPRSRSFSGVTSGDLSIKTQVLEGSRDDSATLTSSPLSPPLSPIRPLQITTKRSKSAMATTTIAPSNVPAPQRATVSHSPTVLRGLHAPSPLSQNVHTAKPGGGGPGAPPPVRSPPPRASTNPLPGSASSPPTAEPVAPGAQVVRALSLDQAAASPYGSPSLSASGGGGVGAGVNGFGSPTMMQSPLATLPESIALDASAASPPSSPRSAKSSQPPGSPRSAMNFPPPSSSSSPRVLRHSRSAVLPTSSASSTRTSTSDRISSLRSRTASQSQSEAGSRPSVDSLLSASERVVSPTGFDEASVPSSPTTPTSASAEGSTLGLRISKRSMRPSVAPLRVVTSNQSQSGHSASIHSASIHSPTLSVTTAASEYTVDGERDTVQVQDTDFELVKPTLPLSPFGASFESLPSPVVASHLRADSPALSTLSGGSSLRQQGFGDGPTSAVPSASMSTPSPRDTKSPKESRESVEAHRQRELRWVSTISSIPASQARKSKKVRKMVLDGVPASVRYQVWATLTDSKGKRMDGLYQKLAQRDKVAVWPEIERDVREGFDGLPMARDGSLGKLLQAYLCMVPDIQYSRGLVMIAGQLLLQSPEEDAFWTFVSLMDSHLRPYFSNNSVQLEVDATLFARALENNDAASAKKVFGDMDIPPVVVCRAWFTTVFADALPSEYLVRLWDVFLFEGVTFLFRAGLAIFSCARRVFLQSTSPDAVLDALSRPPPNVLPPNPDAFIELAFSMKLKDDDIRKQRNKLEAQVKRRTAQTRASPISPATPQTISLPKNGI